MTRTTWLFSDPHFSHDLMVKLRGFYDAEHMDRIIKERWASVVKPGDRIYVLGDIAMKRPFLAHIKDLPGHKRLVMGNHDIFDAKHYLEVGFESIHGSVKRGKLLLTHIPIHPASIPEWALGNVHGHIHNNQPDDFGPRYLNVSAEAIDYTPITVEDAEARLRAQLSREDS